MEDYAGAALNRLLYRHERDLERFATGKASTDPCLTMFYPLWAGVASKEQAAELVKQLQPFERKGGLAMSTRVTGAQWDAPYGWAPTNWLVAKGLEDYGYDADAVRISCAFAGTIDRVFAKRGTIFEKYNVYRGNADVKITAGYKTNVIGFGWTNAVYLKMHQLIDAAGGCGATPVQATATVGTTVGATEVATIP